MRPGKTKGLTMSKTPVGHIKGRLQLVIGDAEPILLTTIQLPIEIMHGSDFATYSLKVDLSSVTEVVQAIFQENS